MEFPDLDDAQCNEIHKALLERRDTLNDIVKKSLKAHTPHPTAERLLKLYADSEDIDRVRGTRRRVPGLLALFAPDPNDVEDTNTTRKEPEPDLFASAAPTGGGNPSAQREWLDKRGNSHPSEAEATAADVAQAELDGGIGAEPSTESDRPKCATCKGTGDGAFVEGEGTVPCIDCKGSGFAPAGDATTASQDDAPRVLALVEGTGETIGEKVDEVPVDYEIVGEHGQRFVNIDDAVHYDEGGRCKGCRAFRGEGHDADCPVVLAADAANAARTPSAEITDSVPLDEPQRVDPEAPIDPAAIANARLQDELAEKARTAKPSNKPPIVPATSTRF